MAAHFETHPSAPAEQVSSREPEPRALGRPGRLRPSIPPWRRDLPRAFTIPALAALTLAVNGCNALQTTARLPVTVVEAVVEPHSRSVPADPATLQTEVLHYAEDFISSTTLAIDEYASGLNTAKARREALRWKLALNSTALSITTGSSPVANLIDFVSMATLMHASIEERAAKSAAPAVFDPWRDAARRLEANAWKIAAEVLGASQQKQLRDAIEQRRIKNSSLDDPFVVRPELFSSLARERRQAEGGLEEILSLLNLDPFAGLDPAVREITRTRLFAERALFASQRMPFVVSWQLELLSEQILGRKETASLLAGVDRISTAVESTSKIAAELPDRFTAERVALVDVLKNQEDKLGRLAGEVNLALTSADKMSVSLNTMLATVGALMKQLGIGEPTNKTPDPNSRAFNILEYAQTAERITAMANQLNTLLKTADTTTEAPALDQRIASLKALADHTRIDVERTLNHAFLLMGGLVVLTSACAIAYRKAAKPSPAKGIKG